MRLPKVRLTNIVEQNLDREILIYDLSDHKAFCLNETSAAVYKACGDGLTFEDLKRNHEFTDDLIHLALGELTRRDLLEDYETGRYFKGLSRREAIRKVGLATVIALPVIKELMAPTAANAASSGACATVDQCIQANTTAYCPTGCTSTVTFVTYNSTDGSCTNPVNPGGQTFSCTNFQGQLYTLDTKRIA